MKIITRIVVFTISVLTANIVSEHLFDFVIRYKKNLNPYVDTLIGMGVVAFIFIPAITLVDKYLRTFTDSYVKTSKKVSNSSRAGIFWAFLAAFIVLYYFYLKLWYNIDFTATLRKMFF